jgi:hypothetical protein
MSDERKNTCRECGEGVFSHARGCSIGCAEADSPTYILTDIQKQLGKNHSELIHYVSQCQMLISTQQSEIKRLGLELGEMEMTFDLRYAADMRAINRWENEHPGTSRMWPDHADLVIWLMEKYETQLCPAHKDVAGEKIITEQTVWMIERDQVYLKNTLFGFDWTCDVRRAARFNTRIEAQNRIELMPSRWRDASTAVEHKFCNISDGGATC